MSTPKLLITTLLLLLTVCHAKLALPLWFGDHMVLQTSNEYGARSFLNGQAEPSETVTVQVGDKHIYQTTADANTGNWKIQLEPGYMYRQLGDTIAVSGSASTNIVTANNVTWGDVFFCSGQSNMVFPLKLAFNASQEMETLKQFPNFKFFVTARGIAQDPQFDVPHDDDSECDVNHCNRWITQKEALAKPDGKKKNDPFLLQFSAVCFLTVRDIAKMHDAIGSKRPVGLIQSAWGGTRVEAWMSKESIERTKFADNVPSRKTHNQATVLYNAMVHPWNHYAVRAVLWYQGEANANQRIDGIDQTEYYATMYQAMIAGWRTKKGMGDFAWGTVQLPPSVKTGTDPTTVTGRMEIRVGQEETTPHEGGLTDISAVAVTLDLGGSGAWGIDHPPNKNEVSRRLALGIVHAAYAKQEPLWTEPVVESISYSDELKLVFLSFSNHTASGLKLRDVKALNIDGSSNSCQKCCSKAPPFEYATSSNDAAEDESAVEWQIVPRESISIEGKSIILDLSDEAEDTVVAIRYAWSDYVQCVLENSDGLVTSPFGHRLQQDTDTQSTTPNVKRAAERTEARAERAVASKTETTAIATEVLQAPPMGFNSWNFYHCNIDENLVKAIADAMVANGMKAAGYRYVNVDDCWQVERHTNGTTQEDPARFPSGMKALADYVHDQGLLLGLYTARGSRTCQGRPGAYQHEKIDAQTYCDWGIEVSPHKLLLVV